MKRKIVIGLLLSLTMVLSGCTKGTISDNLTGLWTVVKIRIDGDFCAYYDFKSPTLELYENGTLLLMELDSESQIRHHNDCASPWKVVLKNGLPYLQVQGGEGTLSGQYRLQFVYDTVESRLFLELTSDSLYLLACHFDTDNIGAPPSHSTSSASGTGLSEPDYQEPVFQVARPEREYLLKKAPHLVKITHGRFTTFGHNPYDQCE
ncbi:MAG: hypothetical protein J6T86_09645 [Bacteroidales bacterium]|nr:hypothetical protein [Bacteroidales bacterium]